MGSIPEPLPATRVSPCRHCAGLVVRDPEGRPIHTSREYACRDVWGVLTGTHAEPPPAPRPFGSAPVRRRVRSQEPGSFGPGGEPR